MAAPIPFDSPDTFLGYLDSLNFFHMDLSLDRMTRALHALHLLRPPYLVVQVVGTNGKGSTATFIDSLLRAYGINTGLYTSPHFVFPSERIRVDGRRVSEDTWLAAARKAWQAEPSLTYFEILTVMALILFHEQNVQVAILEAGLGGRYDATTATSADAVAFVPMALDHTAILGPTLLAIARDKTCAIRSNAPVCSAPQFPCAEKVIRERAHQYGAPLTMAPPAAPNVRLGLPGSHQAINAGTALAVLAEVLPMLDMEPDDMTTARGLREAFIPGRLQYLPARAKRADAPARPDCLLDGAHNPHGMASLVRHLQALPPGEKIRGVIWSSLHDKNWQPSLHMLSDALPDVPFLIPTMDNDRAENAGILAGEIASSHPGITTYSHLSDALAASCMLPGEGRILITGSLYLLAEFFALFPEALEREKSQTTNRQ